MPEKTEGIRYNNPRIIDGNGKILVTNPSDPATGGYVTENQLKEWIGKGVVAVDSSSSLPSVGDGNVLYIVRDTNTLYRWTGSGYVAVSDTSGLAEKSYVDDQLALKANAETTYTKTEVDALVEQAKPSDYDEVKERVSTLEAENTQQAKDIAYLKFANDGKTMIWEESDRDGYSVDVKPATVTGTAFGEAVLKSMEGRDEAYSEVDLASTALSAWYSMQLNGATVWYANNPNQKPNATVYSHTKYTPVDSLEICARKNNSITCHGGAGGSIWLRDDSITDGSQIGGILRYDGKVNTIHNNNVTSVVSRGKNLAKEYANYDSFGGSATDTSIISKDGFYTYVAEVEGGKTYIVARETLGTSRFRAFIFADDPIGSSAVSMSGAFADSGYIITVPVPVGAKFIAVAVGNSASQNVMVRRSDASGTYTPYKPPVSITLPSICSTLHGVGTARDRVSFVNDADGKRWLERKVGSKIFTTADNWSYNASYGIGFISIPDRKFSTQSVAEVLCADFATKNTNDWTTLGSGEMVGNYQNNIVYFKHPTWASANDYKNGMAGKTMVYSISTPQLLDITSEVPEEPSLPIEDGGTLTFVNENKVATPSRISMPVKLGGTV